MPNLGLVTDVALDPYTSHGHDILRGERILNDETVFVLWGQALNEARAGGRRHRAFRRDRRPRQRDPRRTRRGKFEKVQILSYAAKYASTFYGQFRDAIGTNATLTGDKRTCQIESTFHKILHQRKTHGKPSATKRTSP